MLAKEIPDFTIGQIEGYCKKILRDSNGCWIWQGHINRNGYAVITSRKKYGKKNYNLHRILKIITTNHNPCHLVSDHLCRNRKCINPQHIEFVTDEENKRRGIGADGIRGRRTGKGYCTHEGILPNGRVIPMCKPCRRKYDSERPSRKKKPQEAVSAS